MKLDKILLIGAALLLFSAKPKKKTDPGGEGSSSAPSVLPQFDNKSLPRNFRNNNPGNIVINPANKWLGKVPEGQNSDGKFEQFYEFRYGLRAMVKLIKNKIAAGFDTPRKLITNYVSGEAPGPYVENFKKYGINPDLAIKPSDNESIFDWVESMVAFESGAGTITREQFNAALAIL